MKVISFSVFGSDKKYREGLLKNIAASKYIYPDRKVIAYCDRQNFNEIQKKITDENVALICYQEISNGLEGAIWRYIPALDPNVTVAIFRDADSVITKREAEAVNEWLASTFDVHLIRDHPYHTSPIMGGMFGIRGQAVRILEELLKCALQKRRLHVYGDDQAFLNEKFYPLIRNRSLVHTNYVRYYLEHTRPLRQTTTEEHFIGAYAHLQPDEQIKYEIMRIETPPKTLPPPHWENRFMWKHIHSKISINRIKHQSKWRF